MLAHQWSKILVMLNFIIAAIKTLAESLPMGTIAVSGYDLIRHPKKVGVGME